MDFSVGDLEALQKIIAPQDQSAYSAFSSGSTLTPGSFGDQRGETAPPNAKINAIVNRRTHQDIWQDEDLNQRQAPKGDDRPEPEYEILYKQHVGTEDVYLGLGGLDPSSTSCQDLLVKICLPGTRRQDIGLDVDRHNLKLQAPNFRLNLALPHYVHDKNGKAQWDAKVETLNVILPIDKEEIPL